MILRRLTLTLSSMATTAWLLTQGPPLPAASLPTLEIDAGPLRRTTAIVHFTLPSSVRGDPLQLRDATSQTTLPLQVAKDRSAWFIIDSLAAGETRRFVIEPALDRREQTWPAEALQEPDAILLRAQQAPVARFQIERTPLPRTDINPALQRTAYLHPVRTPSGRVVTDDYPSTAPEHHGIWTSWANAVFQGRRSDFWNQAQRTGRVEFEALLDTWSGPVHAGFRSRHRLVDLTTPTPTTALTEIWEVTLYAQNQQRPRPFRMLDVTSTQEAATTSPVALLEHPYGGFAVRGHASWKNAAGEPILITSERMDRTSANGARARWCYMGGRVDGAVAGIAVLSDPRNFHAPQPLRIHSTEPFFSFTPTRLGRLDILPGQALVTRMRVITFDGPPDETWLNQQWLELANPIKVRL